MSNPRLAGSRQGETSTLHVKCCNHVRQGLHVACFLLRFQTMTGCVIKNKFGATIECEYANSWSKTGLSVTWRRLSLACSLHCLASLTPRLEFWPFLMRESIIEPEVEWLEKFGVSAELDSKSSQDGFPSHCHLHCKRRTGIPAHPVQ
jgi:hypothetical protein